MRSLTTLSARPVRCPVRGHRVRHDVADVGVRCAVGTRSGAGSGAAGGRSGTCHGRRCRPGPPRYSSSSSRGIDFSIKSSCVVLGYSSRSTRRKRNRVNHASASSRVIAASGASSRPTTRMAYPRPELSTHASGADQPADDRCRDEGRPQRRESRVHARATPGGVLAVGACGPLTGIPAHRPARAAVGSPRPAHAGSSSGWDHAPTSRYRSRGPCRPTRSATES